MEGMKYLIDSNDQLSSVVCVEEGEIKVEEDPNDHPFCAADSTDEKFNVEEDPSDQLSSAACVKHNDDEER
jgi:hypothetical protein